MKLAKKYFPYLLDRVRFRWLSFHLYAIASIFSVSLRLEGFKLSRDFIFASLGLGILITSVTAILLYIGFSLVDQLQNLRKLIVLPMLMVVGAIRGCLLYYEIELFNYENKLHILASAISSTFYTAIYYAGASLSVELLSTQKIRIQHEFQRATELRLGSLSRLDTHQIDSEYRKSMDSIRDAIRSHLPNNSEQLPNSQQTSEIAEEIREQIQMVLRPLSHRLWFDSTGELRNVSISRTLLDAVKYLDFSPRFILCYQILVGIFGIGLSIGLRDALIKTSIAGVTTIFCFRIYRYLQKHQTWTWGYRSALFLVMAGGFPVITSEAISDSININTNWIAGAIISPTLPALIVVNSIFLLVLRDQQFVLSAAKSVSESQKNALSQVANQISMRELSGYLHNNLQSELLRISKQLDMPQFDEKRSNELIIELENALQRSIFDVQEIRKRGLDRIEAIADAWQGIADITLEIHITQPLDREMEYLLSEAVEEMITNSIRYGDATTISVLISDSPGLSVKLSHNGSGQLHSEGGLGSVWLSSIASGGLTLDKHHGVTSYTLTF